MVAEGRFARATGQQCDGLHEWKRALARMVERSHLDCRKPLAPLCVRQHMHPPFKEKSQILALLPAWACQSQCSPRRRSCSAQDQGSARASVVMVRPAGAVPSRRPETIRGERNASGSSSRMCRSPRVHHAAQRARSARAAWPRPTRRAGLFSPSVVFPQLLRTVLISLRRVSARFPRLPDSLNQSARPCALGAMVSCFSQFFKSTRMSAPMGAIIGRSSGWRPFAL
jgi:hypothetical protein